MSLGTIGEKYPLAHSDKSLLIVLAATVFCSAFLLLQIQPLISKFILPWFGGVPMVWLVCLLFFQIVLFCGYLYAYLVDRFLDSKRQILLHMGFVLAAALTLPVTPGSSWQPSGAENPLVLIFRLLLVSVGLPFFVLSATGPLLQSWLVRRRPARSPFRLYAISNAGSLLALLSYPVLIEPHFPGSSQGLMWSMVFLVFAVLLGCCAWRIWWSENSPDFRRPSRPAGGSPSRALIASWIAWSMVGVVLYMSTTGRLCQDIASVPFLWILPLSLYLLTFVLSFSGRKLYRRGVFGAPLLVILVLQLFALSGSVEIAGATLFRIPLPARIVVMMVSLFVCCMVSHGELYRLRPRTQNVALFYMAIAFGGMIGGIFVSLLAPCIFLVFQELHMAIFVLVAMLLWSVFRASRRVPGHRLLKAFAWALAAMLFVEGYAMLADGRNARREMLCANRDFFGLLRVLKVDQASSEHVHLVMKHGATRHGAQYLSPGLRQHPTAYFSPYTGVGFAMKACQSLRPDKAMNVGIVGLGVGTLAAYGRAGDTYVFYEINPEVLRIATQPLDRNDPDARFTFLEDSAASCSVQLGDARLSLESELEQDERGRQFDLLVLDAFNGDAIPTHLLSTEAFDVYARHMKEDGVIAVHISNNFLDLRPLVEGLADIGGFKALCMCNCGRRYVDGFSRNCDISLTSTWMVLYRGPDFEGQLVTDTREAIRRGELAVEPASGGECNRGDLWTDNYSNLFTALRCFSSRPGAS